MNLVQKIILIFLLMLSPLAFASSITNTATSAASSTFSWMTTDLFSLGNLFSCIEVPDIVGVNQSSTSLDVENGDAWVSTGVYVEQGKMLSLQWDTSGISPRPRKYLVLYRVDPRFSMPQIFIQQYDYTQQMYVSDFNSYLNGGLLPMQNNQVINLSSLSFVQNYFAFISRPTIQVNKGDVVNITLDGSGQFFGPNTQMQAGLGSGDNMFSIYTDSFGVSNKLFYASSTRWCTDIVPNTDPNYTTKCPVGPVDPNNPNAPASYPFYLNPSTDNWDTLTGRPTEPGFLSALTSIPSCPNNVDGPDNIPACFYDKGRGFNVLVAGTVIKPSTDAFVYSPVTGKYFLYYYSDSAGDLSFSTNWPINGMFPNILQYMIQWNAYTLNSGFAQIDLLAYLNSQSTNSQMNFFHFGVYAFEIEVGNGAAQLSSSDAANISLNYTISPTGNPDLSSVQSAPQNFKDNAYASGYLWLQVTGAESDSGTVNVKIANYNGSNWFSTVVYNDIIVPLRAEYNQLSQLIYFQLIGNPALQNIAKLLLTLYIIIYGLVFLAGAVQITATDLVVRILKISVVLALFSETSWTFFNNNLFNVFVSGSDYLFSQVVGVTSSTGNLFGFIDPIFSKYTNPTFWSLLAIQLLQIHNGLTFFAIMTIYGILIYFRAILEVLINYCLAFLGLAVMISLAPFFILLILFERTKSMFDNWLSTLFSYMIQPTILLIFFLLIDQMMTEFITGTVVRACWGILIPIKIGLDLSNIGIPISFAFQLPFLPGIPFFVSQVQDINSTADLIGTGGTFVRIASSSFIFFVYCKMASGLVDYVSLIVQSLTNVIAARQDGKLQQGDNPVKGIMSDMGKLVSPITGAAKGIGNFAKEKISDQKITHRPPVGAGDIDYGKIKTGGDAGDNKTPTSVASGDTPEKKGGKDGGGVQKEDMDKKTPPPVPPKPGSKTPPPLPSRDSEGYKRAVESIKAMKEQAAGNTTPPLPSKESKGYKEGIERVKAKKEKIFSETSKVERKTEEVFKQEDKNRATEPSNKSGIGDKIDNAKKKISDFADKMNISMKKSSSQRAQRRTDEKLKREEKKLEKHLEKTVEKQSEKRSEKSLEKRLERQSEKKPGIGERIDNVKKKVSEYADKKNIEGKKASSERAQRKMDKKLKKQDNGNQTKELPDKKPEESKPEVKSDRPKVVKELKKKGVGIGDLAKNMNPEQKREAAIKLGLKKPTIRGTTDEAPEKKDEGDK